MQAVLTQEGFVTHGRVQSIQALASDRVPFRIGHIMGLDLPQEVAVQTLRLWLVHRAQGLDKAVVRVPLLQTEVDAGSGEALLELEVRRVVAQGLFVKGKRLAPATLRLQLQPLVEHADRGFWVLLSRHGQRGSLTKRDRGLAAGHDQGQQGRQE